MPLLRDFVLRYTVSTFVDAGSLAQDPGLVRELAQQLQAFELNPLPLPQAPPGGVLPFGAFASSNTAEQLILTGTRFDFSYVPSGRRSSTTPTWQEHAIKGSRVLSIVLTTVARQSHRLAFIAEEIATSRSNEGLDPSAIGKRLLHLPADYEGSNIIDWIHKFGRRVERDGEAVNVLEETSHVHGITEGQAFEGIRSQLDVNTAEDNSRPRFGADDLALNFDALRNIGEQTDDRVLALWGPE